MLRRCPVRPWRTVFNTSCTEATGQPAAGEHGATRPEDRVKLRSVLKRLDAYQPPADVEERVLAVARECLESVDGQLRNARAKFQLLKRLEEELGKRVLNSELSDLRSVQDVIAFFKEPVRPVGRYSAMARSDRMPDNLHIIEEAARFHPLTDAQHGGVSAFPKSSTYVPSLRYSRFLKGYRAKTEWHHFEDKHFDYTATPEDAPWLKRKADRMDSLKVDKLCYF